MKDSREPGGNAQETLTSMVQGVSAREIQTGLA